MPKRDMQIVVVAQLFALVLGTVQDRTLSEVASRTKLPQFPNLFASMQFDMCNSLQLRFHCVCSHNPHNDSHNLRTITHVRSRKTEEAVQSWFPLCKKLCRDNGYDTGLLQQHQRFKWKRHQSAVVKTYKCLFVSDIKIWRCQPSNHVPSPRDSHPLSVQRRSTNAPSLNCTGTLPIITIHLSLCEDQQLKRECPVAHTTFTGSINWPAVPKSYFHSSRHPLSSWIFQCIARRPVQGHILLNRNLASSTGLRSMLQMIKYLDSTGQNTPHRASRKLCFPKARHGSVENKIGTDCEEQSSSSFSALQFANDSQMNLAAKKVLNLIRKQQANILKDKPVLKKNVVLRSRVHTQLLNTASGKLLLTRSNSSRIATCDASEVNEECFAQHASKPLFIRGLVPYHGGHLVTWSSLHPKIIRRSLKHNKTARHVGVRTRSVASPYQFKPFLSPITVLSSMSHPVFGRRSALLHHGGHLTLRSSLHKTIKQNEKPYSNLTKLVLGNTSGAFKSTTAKSAGQQRPGSDARGLVLWNKFWPSMIPPPVCRRHEQFNQVRPLRSLHVANLDAVTSLHLPGDLCVPVSQHGHTPHSLMLKSKHTQLFERHVLGNAEKDFEANRSTHVLVHVFAMLAFLGVSLMGKSFLGNGKSFRFSVRTECQLQKNDSMGQVEDHTIGQCVPEVCRPKVDAMQAVHNDGDLNGQPQFEEKSDGLLAQLETVEHFDGDTEESKSLADDIQQTLEETDEEIMSQQCELEEMGVASHEEYRWVQRGEVAEELHVEDLRIADDVENDDTISCATSEGYEKLEIGDGVHLN